MREEKIHTLVLGAGPSGLAAGYSLAKAGCKPVLIERSKFSGGLMRSIRWEDFIVDVGRKELYNRIEKVDKFWNDLLREDFKPYPHRGGVLFRGRIIDAMPAYQGFRRGMPWPMFLRTAMDFAWWRLRPGLPEPTNLQDKFYRQRGRMLTQIFSQGFQEKLSGRKWAETPIEPEAEAGSDGGFFSTVVAAAKRTFSHVEPNTFQGKWRHPAKGTGQICELMEKGLTDSGGRIEYESEITEIVTGGGRVQSVAVKTKTDVVRYLPEYVITSIPIEFLLTLLDKSAAPVKKDKPPSAKNTVVLVYLFLDEPPQFPQAYLHVTCPDTRIGRITNYAAYNGAMAPPGKTALCCEVYCFGEDPLLSLDNKQMAEMVINDCARSHLLNPGKLRGNLVLRLPGADASQNKDNWMNRERLGLLTHLAPYKNLYYTNRTELDLATLAGMEAAEAILAGVRSEFDRRSDPSQIEIRTEGKAFAFT